MTPRHFLTSLILLFVLIRTSPAQPVIFSRDPFLQLQAGGPTAAVQSLAFSPDGETLYSAGYDKVVHSWRRNGNVFAPGPSFRVPVGPAGEGLLNALAVSPDGRWLAAAGRGLMRESADIRQSGIPVPREGRLTDDMLEDQGTIYLFDTTTPGRVRALRNHRGPVLSMIFAPGRADKSALLVSAALVGQPGAYAGQLRLWDPISGKLLRASANFEKPDGRPINLAAWRTGDEDTDLAIAVGNDNQPLRVWDVAGKRLRELAASPATVPRPLAYLPDRPGAGSGSLYIGYAEKGGQLERWTVGGKATPERAAGDPQLVHPTARSVSHALTTIPRRGSRGPMLAAVVAFFTPSAFPNQYRLVVYRQGRGGLEAVVPDGLPLWRQNGQPALAASPDGRFLAVASSPSREVLVYSVADLQKGEATPDRLVSDGMLLDGVEFARVGKDRGLLLREQSPAGKKSSLWLDFGGDLRPEPRGVTSDFPAGSNPWTLKVADGILTLNGPRVGGLPFPFGKSRSVTAATVLPPSAPRRFPLAAIAYIEGGVSHLGLFDFDLDATQIRQYAGHVDRITNLAFDREGKLLASASDDKTVCLWSLADLDEHVGKHGRIYGLAVGKNLTIVALNRDQLSAENKEALDAKKIKVDDVIEHIGRPGKPLRPATPQEFYESLFHTEPRKVVTLRIAGKGDVPMKLDQAIDDRKPLVTFFLRRDGTGTRQWLGWNPHGYYDVSDAGALERRITWQSNPADPSGAVEVSNAAKFRRDFYRKGIVPKLVRHARLDPALKELLREPAPVPRMSLQLEGFDLSQRDKNNNAVIQQVPRTLRAQIDGIEPWRVESVQWRPVGEALRDFDTPGDQVYSADVSGLNWRRGEYKFQLVVTTTDSAEHRSEPLVLRFEYGTPTVRFAEDWLTKQFGAGPGARRVKTEQLLVRAEATTPRVDGVAETPKVRLLLRHEDVETEMTLTEQRGKSVGEKQVTLKKGRNTITVVAVNEGAAADSAFERSAPATLEIYYFPDPPPVPTIVLESVQPEQGKAVSLQPKPAGPVVLSAPRATLRGRVLVGGKQVEVSIDGKPLLPKVKPEVDKRTELLTFLIDQPVKLKPGEPTPLKFSANAPKGKPVSETVTLSFRPQVPRLHPAQPRAWSVKPKEPGKPMLLPLRVQLTRPAYPEYDYQGFFQITGGKPMPATVNKEDDVLSGDVELRPGTNSVQVILRNGYGDEVKEELSLTLLRPPVILTPLAMDVAKGKPLATIVARVQSEVGMPLTKVEAFLNGVRLRAVAPELKRDPSDPRLWQVSLFNVPLREGLNKVEVWAKNPDGESRPESAERTFKAIQRPRIARMQDREVARPECEVEFRIRSDEPAAATLTINDGQVKLPRPAREDNWAVYRLPVKGLRVGANEAVIDCPPADPERFTITYIPIWTAKIHFGKWEPAMGRGQQQLPSVAAPMGLVWLHGEVEYINEAELRKHDGVRIRCWVNDAEQLEARLGPPEGLRRPFRLALCLSRESNRVEVALPASHVLEADRPPSVVMKCLKPEKDQRLHLVVVGPDQTDRKSLVDRVLRAFQVTAREPDSQSFETKAFRQGVLYEFEPGVGSGAVRKQLEEIRGRLQAASNSAVNDVVVVVFSGQERFDKAGVHYLMTKAALRGEARGDLREAIRVDELREILDQTRGSKLLLLDTHLPKAPEGGTRGPVERPAERLGVYRYRWLGEASASEQERLVSGLEEAFRKRASVRGHKEVLDKWAAKMGNRAKFDLVAPQGLLGIELSKP